MKQLSRIFISLALLVPALAVADNCNSGCATTTSNCNNSCNSSVSCNISSCDTSCNQSCCFNSCTTSVCNTSCENNYGCPTLLLKRPTYDNTVIYYGIDYQHQYNNDKGFYGGFQLAFEYQRSFDAKNLARGMFGSSVLNFAGSQAVNPLPNSLLADNFGLPVNFQGSISLNPIISDFNVHLDWFLGLDRWAPGLYLQVDMNFDYQTRQLQSDCACTINYTTSTILFPSGYMSVVSEQMLYPILDIPTALSLQGLFGDKQSPSTFGRFDFGTRTKSGLAGLSINLGYDFVRFDNYFLGAFFRVVAPTGSAVQPCYVFDPVVGNGKGWELGAGLSSRWDIFETDCHKLSLLLDGYVTSVLKHKSLRTFDLASTNTALAVDYLNCNNNNSCNTSCNNSVASCNTNNSCANNSCNVTNGVFPCSSMACSINCGAGNNSCNNDCNSCNAQNCLTRYNLLKQYNLNDGVYTYANNLITAADFTTRQVEVRTPVKGDATVRMIYSHGGFDLGFGYNVFGMVREKISAVGAPSTCILTGTNVFAVKGCQGVGYTRYATTGGIPGAFFSDLIAPELLPLINSASNSTAYVSGSCGNACGAVDNAFILAGSPGVLNAAYNNPELFGGPIDGSYPAPTLNGVAIVVPETSGVNGADSVVLDGSVNELDLCSGTAPRQFTNKGFISLDYTWTDNCWSPYIGFIAEVEGGAINTDIAQWGVVVRGGFAY